MSASPKPLDPARLAASILIAKRPEALADLAIARTGWSNSDVGCGVTYPHEQDHDEQPLSAGLVRVWGGWDDFEVDLPEAGYLRLVETFLSHKGLPDAAARVAAASGDPDRGA